MATDGRTDLKGTKRTRSQKLAHVQKLVQTLLKHGLSEMEIGVKLDVHVHSVTRWRDGTTSPHSGHLRKLERLVEQRSAN